MKVTVLLLIFIIVSLTNTLQASNQSIRNDLDTLVRYNNTFEFFEDEYASLADFGIEQSDSNLLLEVEYNETKDSILTYELQTIIQTKLVAMVSKILKDKNLREDTLFSSMFRYSQDSVIIQYEIEGYSGGKHSPPITVMYFKPIDRLYLLNDLYVSHEMRDTLFHGDGYSRIEVLPTKKGNLYVMSNSIQVGIFDFSMYIDVITLKDGYVKSIFKTSLLTQNYNNVVEFDAKTNKITVTFFEDLEVEDSNASVYEKFNNPGYIQCSCKLNDTSVTMNRWTFVYVFNGEAFATDTVFSEDIVVPPLY